MEISTLRGAEEQLYSLNLWVFLASLCFLMLLGQQTPGSPKLMHEQPGCLL